MGLTGRQSNALDRVMDLLEYTLDAIDPKAEGAAYELLAAVKTLDCISRLLKCKYGEKV